MQDGKLWTILRDLLHHRQFWVRCLTCPHDAPATDLCSFIRTLTGIPIAGQILSTDGGSYWGLVIFTGLCYAGGLAAFVTARVTAVGWKPTTIY